MAERELNLESQHYFQFFSSAAFPLLYHLFCFESCFESGLHNQRANNVSLAVQSGIESHLLWYATCGEIYPNVRHSGQLY